MLTKLVSSILFILSKNEKKYLIILCINSFIIFFLEGLSFLSLIPIIHYISNNESQFVKISSFFFQEDLPSTKNFFLLIILLIFILKNFYLYLSARFNYNFTFNIKRRLTSLLYRRYIEAEYQQSLSNSISYKNNMLTTEINYFINALNAFLNLITEIMTVAVISVILLFLDINNYLILLFFGFVAFFLYKILRKQLLFISNNRLQEAQIFQKNIFESLNLIKEIKVFNNYNFFYKSFDRSSSRIFFYEKKLAIFQYFPKIIFEILGVSCLLFSIFYLFSSLNETKLVISQIAIFTLSVVKIIPSLNRIIFSVQNILFTSSSFTKLKTELKSNSNAINLDNNTFNINNFKKIEFRKIFFKYRAKNYYTLKNIDFILKKNDKICIYGKSGIGKTTLLNIILGLLKPSRGTILFNDQVVKKTKFYSFQNLFGYIPQKIFLMSDTIKSNILFGNKINKLKLLNSIKFSQLDLLINQKEKKIDLNTLVGDRGDQISGGQAQRVALSRAFYNESQILVFDEPTSFLDDTSCKKLLEFIRRNKQYTFVIISHDKRFLKISNKIIHLK